MKPWIQTFTGKQFFPLHPKPQQICIRDIAHALSNICRFNGHSLRHYSVAEHSVRVCCLLNDRGPAEQLWGLLHDAAEAYLGDIVSPVKPRLFVHFAGVCQYADETHSFSRIEDELLRLVIERFGLTWPMPESVKAADRTMHATEVRDLLGKCEVKWQHELGKPHPHRIPDHREVGMPCCPELWEREFLEEFERLSKLLKSENHEKHE
jgi:5'-deoxynucleotidase YfbR-like HD superfamily hydrolase